MVDSSQVQLENGNDKGIGRVIAIKPEVKKDDIDQRTAGGTCR